MSLENRNEEPETEISAEQSENVQQTGFAALGIFILTAIFSILLLLGIFTIKFPELSYLSLIQ